jgi:murein DD-endopeptidase MepM/ murein hydrolase activator NlpD
MQIPNSREPQFLPIRGKFQIPISLKRLGRRDLGFGYWLLIIGCCLLVITLGCASTQPEVTVIKYDPTEQSQLQREMKKMLQNKSAPNTPAPSAVETNVSELGFIRPLQGDILERNGTEGIIIKATEGQTVRAVKNGVVTFASDNFPGYGKMVSIKHPDGFLSIYSYNSEILVNKGQVVKQGDPIATAGKTGRATQTSLHFRLYRNDTPVNPLTYLP